jgi:hypothetical protein
MRRAYKTDRLIFVFNSAAAVQTDIDPAEPIGDAQIVKCGFTKIRI